MPVVRAIGTGVALAHWPGPRGSTLQAMRLHRNPVRWLAGWLAVALLLLQLVTAAHACPRLGVSDLRPASMADMPACDMAGTGLADKPDAPASLLCKMHCQQGQQALDQSAAADLAATPLLLTVLDWTAPASKAGLALADAARRSGVASGAPPAGALPIYLRLLVLRN